MNLIYFYPRSPCGERQFLAGTAHGGPFDFYPRSPCGERRGKVGTLKGLQYFYPRSPCGERRHSTSAVATGQIISIHALLAESDAFKQHQAAQRRAFLSTLSLRRATLGHGNWCKVPHISIHALLAESDTGGKIQHPRQVLFLSTLSLRRATRVPGPAGQHGFHFYPRSPCGERLPS